MRIAEMPRTTADANSPPEISKALQGLAFWMGYCQNQYPFHTLGESALTSTLRMLLSTQYDSKYRVDCEVLYRDVLSETNLPQDISGQNRCDLVIYELKENENSFVPVALIEVKRGGVGRRTISKDMKRLKSALNVATGLRAFLIVTYEAGYDRASIDKHGFIDSKGSATRGIRRSTDDDVKYRVRRVLRATYTASGKNKRPSGHYCCLLEILEI